MLQCGCCTKIDDAFDDVFSSVIDPPKDVPSRTNPLDGVAAARPAAPSTFPPVGFRRILQKKARTFPMRCGCGQGDVHLRTTSGCV